MRLSILNFLCSLLLKLDYPLQSVQCCLDFATNYLRSLDAVTNEYVPRLFLAMTIAVWWVLVPSVNSSYQVVWRTCWFFFFLLKTVFCINRQFLYAFLVNHYGFQCVSLSFFLILRRFSRKGRWSSAQVWFDYSELFEARIVSFLSLYALSRKIEVMLLSLNTCRVTKSHSALDQMKRQITRVRQILALGYEIIISQNESLPFCLPFAITVSQWTHKFSTFFF